jgi:REP element-mobilizing transposase RayT
MPDYRRYYIPNGIVFITAVTKDRKPYLKIDDDIAIFINTLKQVQEIHPFHNHFEYIHWNPIKHGNAKSPSDWKHSTYSYWYEHGYYSSIADDIDPPSKILRMDFE